MASPSIRPRSNSARIAGALCNNDLSAALEEAGYVRKESEKKAREAADALSREKIEASSREALLALIDKIHQTLLGKESRFRTCSLFSLVKIPHFIRLKEASAKRKALSQAIDQALKNPRQESLRNLKADWERFSCCGGSPKADFLALMERAVWEKEEGLYAHPSDLRDYSPYLRLIGDLYPASQEVPDKMEDYLQTLGKELSERKKTTKEIAFWAKLKFLEIRPFQNHNAQIALSFQFFIEKL
jgi:hypothetical protein